MRKYVTRIIGVLLVYYTVLCIKLYSTARAKHYSIYIQNNISHFTTANNTQQIADRSLRSEDLHELQPNSTKADLTQNRSFKACLARSERFSAAPTKHDSTFLHLKDVCFSRSPQGQIIISSHHENTLWRFCKKNVLDVCVPNYMHNIKKTCPVILCEHGSINHFRPIRNKTLNIVSGKMYHFGWHAVFDNFIHYYYTWICKKHKNCGKTTIDTKTCPDDDSILFVDVKENCDGSEVASFLFDRLWGQSNHVIDPGTNDIQCYADAQFGRIDAPFKYNQLLRIFPSLFGSLSNCAFASDPQINEHGYKRPQFIFVNRETTYGPRHVIDLEKIASAVRSRYSNMNVSYYGGLSLLSMKRQFNIFSQRFGIVVSPHGSQLTWILFLKPTSAVVEIFGEDPTYRHKTDYFDISRAVGLQYVKWNAYSGHRRSQRIYNASGVETSTFIGDHTKFLSKLSSITNAMVSS